MFPILTSGDEHLLISAIKTRANNAGDEVDVDSISKYGNYRCKDRTTIYGIDGCFIACDANDG